MDTALARQRVGTAAVGRLATVAADGQPHLVPCVFAVSGDTVFTAVDAKPKRSTALRRLANISANPRVCLLVDHYDDDWSALWWVRVDGTARVVADGPEVAHAVALLTVKYPQYAAAPPAGPVVVIDVLRWVGWSAG